MDLAQLETEINAAWDNRDTVTAATKGAIRDAVDTALAMLDVLASLFGGIRCRRNLVAGMKRGSVMPVFVRFPVVLSAIRRLLRRMPF